MNRTVLPQIPVCYQPGLGEGQRAQCPWGGGGRSAAEKARVGWPSAWGAGVPGRGSRWGDSSGRALEEQPRVSLQKWAVSSPFSGHGCPLQLPRLSPSPAPPPPWLGEAASGAGTERGPLCCRNAPHPDPVRGRLYPQGVHLPVCQLLLLAHLYCLLQGQVSAAPPGHGSPRGHPRGWALGCRPDAWGRGAVGTGALAGFTQQTGLQGPPRASSTGPGRGKGSSPSSLLALGLNSPPGLWDTRATITPCLGSATRR